MGHTWNEIPQKWRKAMTRLIDAEKLKTLMMCDSLQLMLFGKKYELSDALETVNHSPAIDAEEVVRCRDCKHWRENTQFCARLCGLYTAVRMPSNGYCSEATRKEK